MRRDQRDDSQNGNEELKLFRKFGRRTGMARATREKILAADDLRSEVMDVPEWGGEVTIRSLSFTAANGIFKQEVKGFDPRLRLIAACLVDDAGAPIFSGEDL